VVPVIHHQLLHLKVITVVQAFIIITLLVLVEEVQVQLVQTVATMLLVRAVPVVHHRLLDHQLLMQVEAEADFDSLEELLVPVAVVAAEQEQ
jgi:hypothetical protein